MSKVNSAIAMSDLHLGKEYSYLHSKKPEFKDNRKAIIALLRRLGPIDEIIINGDFLELSLAGFDMVYEDVREFFSILSECGPYKRIIYIPGNHDHHFWREIAEQIFINQKINRGGSPPGYKEYPDCFVDKRFSSADHNLASAIILTKFWPKPSEMPEIVVKYPHHLVKIPSNGKNGKYYVLTHGHFLEDLFKPVNYLIDPAHLEELEAFNNLWLEAFDYHICQAGRLSDKVREIVKSYDKGGKEARETLKRILNEIYHNFKKKLNLRWPKTWLLKLGLRILVKKIPIEKKSGLFQVAINDDLKRSIIDYIDRYVINRYQKGKKEEYHLPIDKDIPIPFTFVFGHTHRPTMNLQDN